MPRALLIVASIWIAIILNVAINIGINGASHFYGPTGPCELSLLFASLNVESDSSSKGAG